MNSLEDSHALLKRMVREDDSWNERAENNPEENSSAPGGLSTWLSGSDSMLHISQLIISSWTGHRMK